MTAGSSQSQPVASTGCAAALDQAAAGCVPLESEGPGTAAHPLQAGDASAGCAADATADATADKPPPPQTLREFERALRALGFSQRRAEFIARNGFKVESAAETPQPELTPNAEQLNTLRALLDCTAAILRKT